MAKFEMVSEAQMVIPKNYLLLQPTELLIVDIKINWEMTRRMSGRRMIVAEKEIKKLCKKMEEEVTAYRYCSGFHRLFHFLSFLSQLRLACYG